MMLDRDRTIGGLELLKVPFMNDMEVLDIFESAIEYLKQDAPVEAEEHEVRDYDTGKLITVERFCGRCTRWLDNRAKFCPHCGKTVKCNAE